MRADVGSYGPKPGASKAPISINCRVTTSDKRRHGGRMKHSIGAIQKRNAGMSEIRRSEPTATRKNIYFSAAQGIALRHKSSDDMVWCGTVIIDLWVISDCDVPPVAREEL